MTDYISREAALKACCDECNAMYEDEPCEPSECLIRIALKSMPAADVRTVVLCRECEYAFPTGSHLICEQWGIRVNEDDFCSRGEKKEVSDAKR